MNGILNINVTLESIQEVTVFRKLLWWCHPKTEADVPAQQSSFAADPNESIFRYIAVSKNYFTPGDLLSFLYNGKQRCGEFEKYSRFGFSALVHDYSVLNQPRGDYPRWFRLNKMDGPDKGWVDGLFSYNKKDKKEQTNDSTE
jgi:hypothetical protein